MGSLSDVRAGWGGGSDGGGREDSRHGSEDGGCLLPQARGGDSLRRGRGRNWGGKMGEVVGQRLARGQKKKIGKRKRRRDVRLLFTGSRKEKTRLEDKREIYNKQDAGGDKERKKSCSSKRDPAGTALASGHFLGG